MVKRLVKETMIYGIAGMLNRIIGLFLIPIYTRAFSPDQYGLLDLIVNTSYVLILLSGLQVESGISRSYYEARNKRSNKTLVGTGIMICMAGAMICFGLTCAVYPFLPSSWVGRHEWLWMAVGLAILPSQLLNVAQIVLRMEGMAVYFLILTVGDIFITSCLCVFTVVYCQYGVAGVLWSMLASKLIWTVVAGVWLKKFYTFRYDRPYAKEILAYSLPLLPNGVVAWVQNSASRYLLASAMSLAEVGILGLALKMGSPVAMILTAFRMAWGPYSMEIISSKEFREECARMLNIYWLIGFPICAIVAALGAFIVSIIASHSYLQAGQLVGFVVMGLLWSGAQQIVGLGTDYVRKTYLGLVAYAFGAGLNILLLVLTIKHWGVIGASFASLVGFMGSTLMLMALSQKQHRMPFSYRAILAVGVCSIGLSFWCIWGPSQTGVVAMASDALKKCAGAIAMAAFITHITASKKDKETAIGWLTSGYRRFSSNA